MYIGRLLTAGIFSLLFSFLVGNTIPTSYPQAIRQPAAPQEAAPTNHVSRNWAGYVADNGTYTGVSGTWTVPEVSGDMSGADATWVGIGGVTSHDLIQVGTQATVEENGRVSYEAFWETLPDISQPFSMDINPGDAISATVQRQPNGQWHIALENKSNHQKSTITIPYDSSLSSAEWIEEAPSGMHRTIPLDNFGTVAFQDANAIKDSKQISLTDAGATPLAMGDMYGQPLATTSLVGSDGNSFSVSRASLEQQAPHRQLGMYRFNLRRFFEEGFGLPQ